MSYILDALRKAEQERHLGQAPNPVMPPRVYPRQPRGWTWLAVGLGLGASLMLLGFFLMQRPSQPEGQTNVAPAPAPPAPVAATPAVPVLPPPGTPPVAAPVASVAADPGTSVVPTKKDAKALSPDIAVVTPPASPAPAANIVAPPKKDSSRTRSAVKTVSPAVVGPTQPVLTLPNTEGESPDNVPLEKPERRSKSRSKPSVTIGPAPPPFLEMLPASERQGVPPMNLDLHAYSPDATKRFVVVNGRRYREGEQISPGVLLETISANGAVLRQSGQRFRLSVRR